MSPGGGEDVEAVEEGLPAGEFAERVGDLGLHLLLVVEAPLAVFHLPAEVGPGVEPEPSGVLVLVPRGVEIVQPVGKPPQRVQKQRGRLAWLQAAQEDAPPVDPAVARPGGGRRGRAA